MKRLATMASVLIYLAAAGTAGVASSLDHGQGEMAGRVTETSVILQSRLTKGAKLVDGDLPGSPGVARFELATDPQFKRSRKTRWLTASPDRNSVTVHAALYRGIRRCWRMTSRNPANSEPIANPIK